VVNDPSEVCFICLDLETTGLDPEAESILEIGVVLTDSDLRKLDSFESLVWPVTPLEDLDAFVADMHQTSGLLEDLNRTGKAPSVGEVEARVLAWLEDCGVKQGQLPMMGSSVHFDRSFLKRHMPMLEAFFSYRNIDVSSVKELTRVWGGDQVYTPKTEGVKHRALDDITNTLEEAAYYYHTFFGGERINGA